MLVPAMQSTGMCISSSTLSTPTCAPPRAPPPASARPIRGRPAGSVACARRSVATNVIARINRKTHPGSGARPNDRGPISSPADWCWPWVPEAEGSRGGRFSFGELEFLAQFRGPCSENSVGRGLIADGRLALAVDAGVALRIEHARKDGVAVPELEIERHLSGGLGKRHAAAGRHEVGRADGDVDQGGAQNEHIRPPLIGDLIAALGQLVAEDLLELRGQIGLRP